MRAFAAFLLLLQALPIIRCHGERLGFFLSQPAECMHPTRLVEMHSKELVYTCVSEVIAGLQRSVQFGWTSSGPGIGGKAAAIPPTLLLPVCLQD